MGFITVGKPYTQKKLQKRRLNSLRPEHRDESQKQFIKPPLRRPKITYQKPELTSFPPEILYNIFCHVKMKDNNMNLVNKQLNQLLTVENMGFHYIQRLIRIQFIIDLNEEWDYLIPYIEKLINNFRKYKINSDCLNLFLDNCDVFNSIQYGLNHDIFKYKFAYEIDLHYYRQFFISNGSTLITERGNRFKYIKKQLKRLNYELLEFKRLQSNTEINFDELSRMANRLFNQEETNGEQSLEPEANEDQAFHNRGDEPEVNLQLDYNSYNQTTPKFPKKFRNINSLDKFKKIKSLINGLNFTYEDLNVPFKGVLNSRLTLKHKCKVLLFLIKTYLDPNHTRSKSKSKVNHLLIKDFKINLSIITRAFELLIESGYNQKFEAIVHEFLKVYYQTNGQEPLEQDGAEEQNDDTELWNFVKESKQPELFQLLCGYSAPNFSL